MEALLGTLLSTEDKRVRAVISDLAGDPLAREILDRVDESPFGTRGKEGEDRASRILRTTNNISTALPYSTPSVEWQDHLKERLRKGEVSTLVETSEYGPNSAIFGPPRLSLDTSNILRAPSGESPAQRRRIDSSSPLQRSALSHVQPRTPSLSPSPSEGLTSMSEDDLNSAIGQLSLNEDSQVRYHGEASGLHILGMSDRLDKRNEGGLWRFPRAGVWPRASRSVLRDGVEDVQTILGPGTNEVDSEKSVRLPNKEVQEDLLEMYFAYVHPVLPVMIEKEFWREYRGEPDPETTNKPSPSSSSPSAAGSDYNPKPSTAQYINKNTNNIPNLLLLAMFAIAARYKTEPEVPLPLNEGDMWNAGDEYLEDAKKLLNSTYALSRPTTCQALLLLSYREIGIGGMAQAWLYVGMAVRMAQDLGMHRAADKWQRTGAELFTETEKQIRRRIWYSSVVMDKFVFKGRPLAIFERDFDTHLPLEEHDEEMRLWLRHNSPCAGEAIPDTELPSSYVPVPTRLISCFNAASRLCGILSNIVETTYAVQPQKPHARLAELAIFEKRLDKWYLDLPKHLELPTSTTPSELNSHPLPPPHVLTLHMQYWCSVLLAHRPFMRRKFQSGHDAASQCPIENDTSDHVQCTRAFDLCATAANKISSIVGIYKQNFCLRRAPAFLTYYVFSAGIMHMTTLSVRPGDVQAGLGLQLCMDALQTMSILWPSAGRAWELLHGAKIDLREVEQRMAGEVRDKRKREDGNNSEFSLTKTQANARSRSRGVNGIRSNSINGGSNGIDATNPRSHHYQPPRTIQLGGLPSSHSSASPTHRPSSLYTQALTSNTGGASPVSAGVNTFPTWPNPPTPPSSSSSAPGNGSNHHSPSTSDNNYTYASYGVGSSNGYDSKSNSNSGTGPVNSASDVWKDISEGFNHPALITSSLYGLPVMQGSQSTGFIGDFNTMYNMQSTAETTPH
ncbi:hypothetical protein Clacol_008859 [Clathrus columnatus]|uniref:Xylanolytic transcriptional activator regulatory domain-containing protein n=1 Tax=Clathrus columnatus TaxID=1419009 RepID=A0AAV5API6_9AGAM|nr:hypothetical protein Clacol_008859 [Clathrus columnatus]